MSCVLFTAGVFVAVLCMVITPILHVWKKEVHTKMSPSLKKFLYQRVDYIIGLPILMALISVTMASWIYEFKPVFNSTQYRIIRDKKGNISALEKNATGFHLPFYSNQKFVNLPKTMRSWDCPVIKFRTGEFGDSDIEIKYSVTCDDYPSVFIETNGVLAQGKLFYAIGETDFGFADWQKLQVESFLNSLVSSEIVLKNMSRDKASVVVGNFVLMRVEEFNLINKYGLKIEIKEPRLNENRAPFSVQ